VSLVRGEKASIDGMFSSVIFSKKDNILQQRWELVLSDFYNEQ